MQYINLIPQQTAHRFTLLPRYMLLLVLLTLMVLLALGYRNWHLQQSAEQQVRAEVERLQTIRNEVLVVRSQLTNIPDVSMLQSTAQALTQQRNERVQVLNTYQAAGAVVAPSYYEFLASLSRQRMDGVWLTGFELATLDNTNRVVLRGATESTDLLPRYLDRLASEQRQISLRFRGMQLAQLVNEDNHYRFELSTSAPTQTVTEPQPARPGLPGLNSLPGGFGLLQGMMQ